MESLVTDTHMVVPYGDNINACYHLSIDKLSSIFCMCTVANILIQPSTQSLPFLFG